jgi:hypothetical protein
MGWDSTKLEEGIKKKTRDERKKVGEVEGGSDKHE